MLIIHEGEVNENISTLDKAWSSNRSFVFVPDKGGVSIGWIEAATRELPDDLRTGHFALLTSGSTGLPKLVLGSKKRAEQLVKVLHEVQDSEPVSQTVLTLPLTYCYAFVNQWLWTRVFGRELVPTAGFRNPERLKQFLSDASDAMLCLVGAQIPLFMQHFANASFPGIIRLHFAGGPFPQDKMSFIKEFFPNALIFNNYGCAEAMPRLTIRRQEESEEFSNIGKPIPGVTLESNENEELFFRSPYSAIMFCFSDGFKRTAPDELIPTGDLARIGKDGYWRLIGRANEIFKRYGEKIALPMIKEAICTEWPGAVEFYHEKDASGENGYILVLSPEPSGAEVKRILRIFREHYARTHWPLRIESVPSIPLLPNDKIDALSLARAQNKAIHWRQRI